MTHRLAQEGALTREGKCFRVTCSCGKYTTTADDRDTALRRLDKHMERHW